MKHIYRMCEVILVGIFCAGTMLLFPASSADAEEIVITLDNVPAVSCGETWTESGVELSFINTTSEDCSEGSCSFGVEPDQVWLYPGRLNIDLASLEGTVTQVEIDVLDYCGAGCTAAFLYEGAITVDSAFNTVVSTGETLLLSGAGAMPDRLAVSSCEGIVQEIRLTVENVVPSSLTISPPTGEYVTTQDFDLALIVKAPGLSVTGGSATLDGSDVIGSLNACVQPGTLISGGMTFRCTALSGGFLGTGSHTLDITLDLSDSTSVTDSVSWEVLDNTEP